MLTEEQKSVHSEYRKYLRIVEGIKGNMLNTLVNATEKSLPTLIREHKSGDGSLIRKQHLGLKIEEGTSES